MLKHSKKNSGVKWFDLVLVKLASIKLVVTYNSLDLLMA